MIAFNQTKLLLNQKSHNYKQIPILQMSIRFLNSEFKEKEINDNLYFFFIDS